MASCWGLASAGSVWVSPQPVPLRWQDAVAAPRWCCCCRARRSAVTAPAARPPRSPACRGLAHPAAAARLTPRSVASCHRSQPCPLPLQSARIPDGLCAEDGDCPAGEAVVAGNGEGGSFPLPCSWQGQVLPRPQPARRPRDLAVRRAPRTLLFLAVTLRSPLSR